MVRSTEQVKKEHKPKPKRKRIRETTFAMLPSLMTLGNLLCGFAAIFYASRGEGAKIPIGSWSPLAFAAALIFVGMLFDALDGRVARMTGQTSEFGAQLDSMADMVTFGIAPAFLTIQLIGIGTPFINNVRFDHYFDRLCLLVAGIYVACCALRLARFNIEVESDDEDDHMHFKGLPSPGAGGTVAGLVLLLTHLQATEGSVLLNQIVGCCMVIITFIAALGMVSSLRYSHAVNRFLRDRAPLHYIVIFVIAALLMFIAPQWFIAICFVGYALSAPAMLIISQFNKKKTPLLLSNNSANDNTENQK